MGDDDILKALETLTSAIRQRRLAGDQGIAGMEKDPTNMPKSWSGIKILMGPNEKPPLHSKDYVIEKLALGEGQEMPHDSSMGSVPYARPL